MDDIDRATFKSELRRAGEDLSPARANLLLAREIAYPDLRPSDYVIQLDDLSVAGHAALAGYPTPETRGLALAEFLFHSVGFRGDSHNYTNPRNSYLNDVLEQRAGLPISLSVIFLEVARRLGIAAAGVGMPGHFIVSVQSADGSLYLDPFHGGMTITRADCERLVSQATGYPGSFDSRWLAPSTPRDIVARMLNNLRNFYVQAEDWPHAIAVVERLRTLQPHVNSHWRDLGLLHYRAGAYHIASEFLDQYLAREPDAHDAQSVRQNQDRLLDHLTRLN
jgi:regulator of sirC expression with transglutaminase-like and TPR domain